MNLTILTPEKEVFNGQIKSVKVPGASGQFEVFLLEVNLVRCFCQTYDQPNRDSSDNPFQI